MYQGLFKNLQLILEIIRPVYVSIFQAWQIPDASPAVYPVKCELLCLINCAEYLYD